MKAFIITCMISVLLSCNQAIDVKYIRAKTWSYEKGFKIGQGDIIVFDENYKIFELRNDTILYDGTPRAIILSLDKERFKLVVMSLSRREKGVYRNIEESLN